VFLISSDFNSVVRISHVNQKDSSGLCTTGKETFWFIRHLSLRIVAGLCRAENMLFSAIKILLHVDRW
jgi:hypothetical protein